MAYANVFDDPALKTGWTPLSTAKITFGEPDIVPAPTLIKLDDKAVESQITKVDLEAKTITFGDLIPDGGFPLPEGTKIPDKTITGNIVHISLAAPATTTVNTTNTSFQWGEDFGQMPLVPFIEEMSQGPPFNTITFNNWDEDFRKPMSKESIKRLEHDALHGPLVPFPHVTLVPKEVDLNHKTTDEAFDFSDEDYNETPEEKQKYKDWCKDAGDKGLIMAGFWDGPITTKFDFSNEEWNETKEEAKKVDAFNPVFSAPVNPIGFDLKPISQLIEEAKKQAVDDYIKKSEECRTRYTKLLNNLEPQNDEDEEKARMVEKSIIEHNRKFPDAKTAPGMLEASTLAFVEQHGRCPEEDDTDPTGNNWGYGEIVIPKHEEFEWGGDSSGFLETLKNVSDFSPVVQDVFKDHKWIPYKPSFWQRIKKIIW